METERLISKLTIKTLIAIAMSFVFYSWSLFLRYLSEIKALEVSVMRMESEVKMNSEFRIRWPRGEMGSLPDDAEQNLRLLYIEKNTNKYFNDVDEMKLKLKELEDCK